MSVKIRLRRMGAKNRPFYRLVVADSRFPRDGRFIEALGNYQPIFNPAKVSLKEEKVYEWLNRGALPSETVHSLFRRIGLLKKWELMKKGQDVSAVTIDTEIFGKKKLKGKAKKAIAAKSQTPAAEGAGAKKEG